MHPAMRHVGPVRRELGIPTVMNIVGPLANPAGAGRQVVGVADLHRIPLVAGALSALGSKHALVVHGEPGIDEVSPLGRTFVAEIRDGSVREWTIDPEEYGLGGGTASDLRGGSPTENAARTRELLSGGGSLGARAAVILNAAAALYVAECRPTFAACVTVAETALGAGVGREVLDRMIAAYRD
jgi:anthranilate phosphoribosyltransferase